MAWVAQIEDYILEKYGEDSSPFRLFKKADIEKANGNYQDEFDKQHSKIIAALKACSRIEPKNKNEATNL